MMPFATFSNSGGMVRMGTRSDRGTEFGMWSVRLWFLTRDGKTEHAEITTTRPCSFDDLTQKEIIPEINAAFDTLAGITDSGFIVYRLRGAKPSERTNRKKAADLVRRAALQRTAANRHHGAETGTAEGTAEALRGDRPSHGG